MREFRYKALTAAGEMVVGIRRAPNAAMLAQELFEQNLTMLDSRPTLGSLGAAFSSAGHHQRP